MANLAAESDRHHARLAALPRSAQRHCLEDQSGGARDSRPVARQLVRARLEEHDGGVGRMPIRYRRTSLIRNRQPPLDHHWARYINLL